MNERNDTLFEDDDSFENDEIEDGEGCFTQRPEPFGGYSYPYPPWYRPAPQTQSLSRKLLDELLEAHQREIKLLKEKHTAELEILSFKIQLTEDDSD
jgi:hypothetical protein